TSKLMMESFVGVAVPATRQNCGSPVFVVHPVLPVVQPGGVLNVPPVTVSAAVTRPWGRARFIRPSQVVAACSAVAPNRMATSDAVESTTAFWRVFMSVLPYLRFHPAHHAPASEAFSASVLTSYLAAWSCSDRRGLGYG